MLLASFYIYGAVHSYVQSGFATSFFSFLQALGSVCFHLFFSLLPFSSHRL